MILNSNKSLAYRVVLYVLMFCMATFILTIGFFYFYSKSSITRMTKDNAELITQNTAQDVGQIFLGVEKILANHICSFYEHKMNPDSLHHLTEMITKTNPEILASALAFEPYYFESKGRYFCPYSCRKEDRIDNTFLGGKDYEYFYMDWYQVPTTIEEPYWSEPYFDEGASEKLITTYSVPLFETTDEGRRAIGVFTVDLSLDWLTEKVSAVKILESGYATVLTKNGTFVTHPNSDYIMNQTIFSVATENNSDELRSIGRLVQQGGHGFIGSYLFGMHRTLCYMPLATTGWSMIVIFKDKEMYAPLRKITVVVLILLVFALILLSVLIMKVVEKQIKPLSCFAKSAAEIADGNFEVKLPNVKTQDEMKELHSAFEHMQTDLKTYIDNLKVTTSAKEKIESELRIAREIQMGMIPKIFPPFPNVDEIDLYAVLHPAREVGGDLYDFFMIDDNHLCFAIGDVSGKGVPASLFMAVTRTLLRSVSPNELSTTNIVESLNNSLAFGNEASMFVTFFIGIINLKSGKLKYSNAGHNPPIMVKNGTECDYFEPTCEIPIGIYEDFTYSEHVRYLERGDTIFLYTDGVTEAEDCNEVLYSDARLLTTVRNEKVFSPKEIIERVKADVAVHVEGFQQSDDLTMLSVIYHGTKE